MGERGTPFDRLAGSGDRYESERQLPPEIGTLMPAPFPAPEYRCVTDYCVNFGRVLHKDWGSICPKCGAEGATQSGPEMTP